ncbi:MAG: DUF4131 domain-containing protein [Verrucomicrobiaceae bacterium]|nr:MAG: DUF4131 domain-containing protein [Verrucomicrobiaceae bacterium]
MTRRRSAFVARHPLFVAALVAVCGVLAARWDPLISLAVVVALATAAIFLMNWRAALACLLCGGVAAGSYLWRIDAQQSAERGLLSMAGGEFTGRVLKDGKGGGVFWTAPVRLEGGPQDGVKVWWAGRGEPPVSGAVVKASGNFAPLPGMRNPGDFDQAGWLRSQGIAALFQARQMEGTVETGAQARFGAKVRKWFRTAVTVGLEEDSREAMVIRAVVIGEQPADAEELIAAFRNSGTLHAFSVSGMHVSMVALIGWFVLGWLGVPRRWAILVLLPLIFGYSWISGNSAPAVRSAWMAAVFLGAFMVRRKPDLLNALGIVLLVTALWDGRLLFLPGVQLSYLVVAAIAIGARWTTGWFSWMAQPELYLPLGMMSRWQRVSLWLRRKLSQSLGVSIAAAVGSTPLTIYHFSLLTPVSILAGVVFGPVVLALLCVALFSTAVYPVAPGVAAMTNRGNAWLAKGCTGIAGFFATIPGGHHQIRQETDPFLLVYDLEYGAGAACFSGGEAGAVLIDCADRYSFRKRVAPSLRRLGVEPDSVVITHPDGGHLGGGAAVWETFPIKQALLPVERSRSPGFRSWRDDAPAAGVKLLTASEGGSIPLPDGARLEIIHTPDTRSQNASADDRVAIYRLHWRNWKILFTSDSGLGTELEMLDRGKDLQADIIIAGKHRSDTSLSDRFLDAVNPQAIIASHSDFPVSERLNPQRADYWHSRGIDVVNQAHAGGVTLRIDAKGKLVLEGFADKSVLTLSPR